MAGQFINIRRTKKEIAEAVSRYARRHNVYAKTVCTNTMLYRAAMLEDEVKRGALSLADARQVFTAGYPNTRKGGPMHVNNWIK